MNLLDFEIPPRVMQAFHLWVLVVSTVLLPVAALTSLRESVSFLVVISIMAIQYGAVSAWQASLAERRLDDNDSYGESK